MDANGGILRVHVQAGTQKSQVHSSPLPLSDLVNLPAADSDTLSEQATQCQYSEHVRQAQEGQHLRLLQECGLPLSHAALQRWRFTEAVGHGAFSKVYRAVRRDAGSSSPSGGLEQCVVKVVDLGKTCKIRDDYKHILRAEGRYLKHFHFPGFVQCYGIWGHTPVTEGPLVGQHDQHLVLALEHLTGGMLLDRLKKGPMREHHAAAAFYQILTCITYMHHDGHVHRDLKPDNVMLAAPWDPVADENVPPPVRLIDLGMVLNFIEEPNVSGLMGSPGYMSPEAIRGHRHTPQMDMYSLGVLLFVMLTGCKPIPSATCTALSYDTMEACDYPGARMSQFKRISPAAQEFVLALMQRRPAERPNARQALGHRWLQEHLQGWLERGHDLRHLSIPAREMQDLLERHPSADVLVAKARAARPIAAPARHVARAPATPQQVQQHQQQQRITAHAASLSAAAREGRAKAASPYERSGGASGRLPFDAYSGNAGRVSHLNVIHPTLPTVATAKTPESMAPPCTSPVTADQNPQLSRAALSDTIDNILGLITMQSGAGGSAHAVRAPPPAPVQSGAPPSAASINRALHAVLHAAEKTAAEKCQSPIPLRRFPSLPSSASPFEAHRPRQAQASSSRPTLRGPSDLSRYSRELSWHNSGASGNSSTLPSNLTQVTEVAQAFGSDTLNVLYDSRTDSVDLQRAAAASPSASSRGVRPEGRSVALSALGEGWR